MHFIVCAIDLLAIDSRQMEVETNEVLTMSEREFEFFCKLTTYRVTCRLARMDLPAEAAPVPGVKDARDIIAKLQQIAAVSYDNNCSRSVLGLKRAFGR
jgi:hypothetical protein